MSVHWDDLNVRAQGLTGHLLPRDRLGELAAVRDLPDLAARLTLAGFEIDASAATRSDPGAIEAGVRRFAQRELAVFSHWCGERRRFLAFVFEDEDRRSLRALLRGSVAGVESPRRLLGLVPTLALPEKLLAELSRLQSPLAISEMLSAIGNPYGRALHCEATPGVPDLFSMEGALNRTYAARAVTGARGGGSALERFVEETIDLDNVQTALLLASQEEDTDPDEAFLSGGRELRHDAYLAAATSGDPAAARAALVAATTTTTLGRLVEAGLRGPGPVEQSLLAARLRWMTGRSMEAPLSPAPFLTFLLRLRAHSIDLHSIIWGIALGQPSSTIGRELVSVP